MFSGKESEDLRGADPGPGEADRVADPVHLLDDAPGDRLHDTLWCIVPFIGTLLSV